MAEFKWIKAGDKLKKGDVIISRCKRFAAGFIDDDKFGVFVADDISKASKRVLSSINCGAPVNPAKSEIYAEISDLGFGTVDFLGPGPYTLSTWSTYLPGTGTGTSLIVSDMGSLKLLNGFDDYASNPPGYVGTSVYESDSAVRIVQVLEVRHYEDPSLFVYRDEITVGPSFIYDSGSPGVIAGPYIDKKDNYEFNGAKLAFNPIYDDNDAQSYYDEIPAVMFHHHQLTFPTTDPSGIEITSAFEGESTQGPTTPLGKLAMTIPFKNYTLKIEETAPHTASGRVQVDVSFQKVVIIKWTGTVRDEIKTVSGDLHMPIGPIDGSLIYAYDPTFTFTPVP